MTNKQNVHAKLQEARMKLIAQPIKKGARNEFAKYNYMELADFLIPTQQIFKELNLCGVVSFTADLATLTITDIDSGQQIHITSPMSTAALKGCHEVQNLGAVQTYLRRYLWVSAMEIVEHDAIDSAEPVNEKASNKASNETKNYPSEDFQKNLPEWVRMIEAGLKTPEQIITIVESKGRLSKDQKAIIASVKTLEAA